MTDQNDNLKRAKRRIQVGRSVLGMDDAIYRQMLANLCAGKTSSTTLTYMECEKVLAHMKRLGFKPQRKATSAASDKPAAQRVPSIGARDPQLSKLIAMWAELERVGAVRQRDSEEAVVIALEGWAKKRMPKLQALRFATGAQMSALIEQMKSWVTRVGGNTL